jgi:hypothetical protein
MQTRDLVPPSAAHDASPALLLQLKSVYAQFSLDTLPLLDSLYTADVEFRDPIHTLHGLLALRHYLRNMAGNLRHYHIRYLDEVVTPNAAYLTWEMDYSHHRLKHGALITVRGMTQVKFTDKIFYHEDCYDLGALLYEHLPALGFATRQFKKRLAK